MEFDEHQNNFGRSSSTMFGAIFMSNHATKKECFKRKLFGLPSSQSGFVGKVKAGMVLFLFEYEERKLYGVFQATSDGAMNIVPNAFRSSGKQIPAQVLFKTVWNCRPLSERDFRDAIKDNYYTTNKFNFGLTEDQVSKLLWLFNSRKVKIQKPINLFSRDKVKRQSRKSYISSVRVYQEDRYITTGSFKNKPSTDNEPVDLTGYADLHRSNLSLSYASHKHILETKNSLVEAPHRLPLAALPSTEPQISLPCLTSYIDMCDERADPLQNLYRSKTSSVLFGSSSSLGLNDHSLSPKLATYSKSSTDPSFSFSQGQLISSSVGPNTLDMSASGQHSLSGTKNLKENLFSLSRSQHLTPFHSESEGFNRSQTRCGGLDATTSLGDYIPLSYQDHFELSSATIPSTEFANFRNKSVDPSSFERYKGLSFPETSVTELPLSQLDNFRQEDTRTSLDAILPRKSPSHLHGDNRTRHSNYDFASASISSTDVGQLHSPVAVDPSDFETGDFYEKTGQESPIDWANDDYDHKAPLGLYYGDVRKKRLSVFSRLAMNQEASRQTTDDGYGCEDMSVSQVMGILHQRESYWRKNSKQHKPIKGQYEAGDSFEGTREIEMSLDPVSDIEDGKFTERMETPFINFKRRSKNREVKDGEREEMPSTAPKRRKLVRPSFATIGEPARDKDVISDPCHKLHESSQEIFEGQENLGTDMNLVTKNEGDNDEKKSQNSLQNAVLLVGCKNDNAKSETDSIPKDLNVKKEAPQDGIHVRDCFLNLSGSTHENVKMEHGLITKDFEVEPITQEFGGIKDSSLNVLDSSEDKVVTFDNSKAEESSGNAQELADLPLTTECNRKEIDDKVEQKDVFKAFHTVDLPLTVLDSSQNEASSTRDNDTNKSEEESHNALRGHTDISSIKSEGNGDANGFHLELSLSSTNFSVNKEEQKHVSGEVGKRGTASAVVIDLNLIPEN